MVYIKGVVCLMVVHNTNENREPEMLYFIAFTAALLIMLGVTPQLRKLAFKIDYLEKPNVDIERKIHTEPKPYLAAVGMFGCFWVLYLAFVRDFSSKTFILFASSFLIFAIGMLDDWFKINGKDLKALPKLVVQLVACILVYRADILFRGFTNPFDGSFVLLPYWLQLCLTVIWLFGVTTVINFADGLDGLAGGISCISACTLFVVALAKGQNTSAIMAILLVGICLGYLRYNKFPAKILMGDSGATFLGFMLGLISLDGAFKQATVISIFVPILALGLPIFDNIFVVFRRMKQGKPIYVGDSGQVHYRLLSKGFSQKQAVQFLYLICICLNLTAIILFLLKL